MLRIITQYTAELLSFVKNTKWRSPSSYFFVSTVIVKPSVSVLCSLVL